MGPVHRLEGRLLEADVQGEEGPQEHLALAPIDPCLYIQAPRPGEEPVGLYDPGASPAALDANSGAKRTILDHLDGLGFERLSLELVIFVHVPGVPLPRL